MDCLLKKGVTSDIFLGLYRTVFEKWLPGKENVEFSHETEWMLDPNVFINFL